ncbi:MAG TPA: alpha/beta fold hydrolase [Caulobacteraceae bacterium]|jgi:pimeloyl-ACP methyl ester carboxylesterase|nr:alpha/beta fold hydrolase [Caulobacteraceae bacterium]
MASFRSGDFDVAYDQIAPPGGSPRGDVLLVHGFASNRLENWKRLGWYAAIERAGWRLIAPDLRGHGESAKPHDPDAYGRGELVADLIALLDHLEVERPHVVGYSMGAHLALGLALTAPRRVDRLVLGGLGGRLLGVGPPRTAPSMSLSDALLAGDPAEISDPVQRGFRQFAEQQGDDRQALAACTRAPAAEPVSRERLAMLDRPVLVVAGSRDELAGDPQDLADAIPGARALTLPACDHFSAIPHALFKSAVFDFLDDFEEPPAWE